MQALTMFLLLIVQENVFMEDMLDGYTRSAYKVFFKHCITSWENHVWISRGIIQYSFEVRHCQLLCLVYNAMMELLWIHNSVEAQSKTITANSSMERWKSGDRTPFGICLVRLLSLPGDSLLMIGLTALGLLECQQSIFDK